MKEEILNYIFPDRCGLCGKQINERYTCRNCINIIEYYRGEGFYKKDDEAYYDKLIMLYKYEGMLKTKMLELKFENKRSIAKSFGELLARRIKEYNIQADMLIPVPISMMRLIERGFNQTEYIAKYATKFINIELDTQILRKTKNNNKQSNLSRIERIKNVQGVYKISKTEKVRGKTVLLLDDIFSTGATINECSKMLKEVGAKSVIAMTLLYSNKLKERSQKSGG